MPVDPKTDDAHLQQAPTKKQFVIFNSWKSDHSPTRDFINEALELAAKQVEQARPDLAVVIDAATRGLPGSPNIPVSIMDKIKAADMVVSDVTIINPGAESRRSPNPNVAFELGYAVANLGWDRVVMVFNKGVAKFNDLPFDFDRHRAIAMSTVPPENALKEWSSKSRKAFAKVLAGAIERIITDDPARPTANMSPMQLKRAHDRKQLLRLLEQFDIDSLDQFAHLLPKVILDVGDDMWLGVNGVMSSNSFALYDDELRALAEEFRSAFGATLAYSDHYDSSPDMTRHTFNWRNTSAERAHKGLAAVSAARDQLLVAMPAFLDSVRRKFPDIHLDETSRIAREEIRQRVSRQKAFD